MRCARLPQRECNYTILRYTLLQLSFTVFSSNFPVMKSLHPLSLNFSARLCLRPFETKYFIFYCANNNVLINNFQQENVSKRILQKKQNASLLLPLF